MAQAPSHNESWRQHQSGSRACPKVTQNLAVGSTCGVSLAAAAAHTPQVSFLPVSVVEDCVRSKAAEDALVLLMSPRQDQFARPRSRGQCKPRQVLLCLRGESGSGQIRLRGWKNPGLPALETYAHTVASLQRRPVRSYPVSPPQSRYPDDQTFDSQASPCQSLTSTPEQAQSQTLCMLLLSLLAASRGAMASPRLWQ